MLLSASDRPEVTGARDGELARIAACVNARGALWRGRMGNGTGAPGRVRTSATPPDKALLEAIRIRSIKRLATEFGVRLPPDAGKDRINARRPPRKP